MLKSAVSPNPSYIDGGKTPLHLARGPEVTQMLIDAGAIIDVKCDNGLTPLEDAKAHNKTEKILILENAIADPTHILKLSLKEIVDKHWALKKDTPNRKTLMIAFDNAMQQIGIELT